MSRQTTIQKRLKQLQLSKKQLAKHAMLSESALTSWIAHKIVIPYKSVLRISDLLDLEPDELVDIV